MRIAQLLGWLRVGLHFHKGVAVMSGNDIAVGKPSTRKSSTPAAGSLAFEHQDDRQKAHARGPHSASCGAMSQQRDDSGSQSTPQKLVQLVGCRDPKARNNEAGNNEGGNQKAGKSKAGSPKARPQLKR
jgi:hypothetical protein